MPKLALAVVLALMAGGAQAATLNAAAGQLHETFGVDIGGMPHDVDFVDGTCIDLSNGCGLTSDSVFTTWPDATSASQALVDYALVDGGASQNICGILLM